MAVCEHGRPFISQIFGTKDKSEVPVCNPSNEKLISRMAIREHGRPFAEFIMSLGKK